ncbi:hypothetical protein BBP40_000608 [Aspergillus hancockii]|nr:hypothetical protein BBP40_000608 [Aspergillus hancockii]
MVKIAVAGGAKGLGSAIVKGIEWRGVHECCILSRTANKHDPRYLAVDYNYVENLRNVLEANNTHTVISVLSMENGGGESQMNLIEAAEQSKSTSRFMPSKFGMVYQEKHMAALPSYTCKLKAGERLKNSSLEYTHFSIAFFALPVWIDLENDFAGIPGDGEVIMSLAHTSDIGRCVAALQDLPKWETRYHLIGDRLSINDMVRIAEEVKDTKSDKHYNSKEKLLENRCTILPAHKALLPPGMDESFTMAMIAASGVRVIDGEMDLDVNLAVNGLFLEMKTCTVRDAVQIWKEAKA